ncbi:hypothetical protein FHS31_000374 [Sphingomonas vulcanisoli]|uniref:Acyloxyacyl hydrolase n=1 Tax=Sphingomonas vulcanisoli TaxID=1658060 RepID=A0ABX0TQX6_9SPHN|nr:acyloxyacyl hydrolase [Sphingomonas vulcanisoli]NIJ06792.1 hypothetical protein [Sphingomonas vulcanisoli]
MNSVWGSAAAAAIMLAVPASANDLFGGVYRHDLLLFTKDIHEGGADFEFGYRWNHLFTTGPIRGLQPYVVGSVNSRGGTDFAAAGLGYKIGHRLYIRPGLGIAIHDGPHRRYDSAGIRTDLGSRVVFEPELALGFRVAPRIGVEASFTHLSHAQIFSQQNPGIDNLGVRVNLKL